MQSTQYLIINFIKRYLPLLGTLLVCLSFVFIYFKISEHFEVLSNKNLISNFNFKLILIASTVYAFICYLLAIAWCKLIQNEERFFSTQLLISIFGKSQIAKYLPGNVFHFIGRQVLSRDYGFSHGALFRSSFWEIGLHFLAAVLTGLLLLIASTASILNFFLVVTYLALLLIGIPLLNKLIEKNRLQALGIYSLFHVSSGFIFVIILIINSDAVINTQVLLITMGAYIIAWLAGFVTLGAPGGIGIREIVLFFLLSPWVDHSTILITLAMSRIVTIVGDILFFIFALYLGRQYPKQLMP